MGVFVGGGVRVLVARMLGTVDVTVGEATISGIRSLDATVAITRPPPGMSTIGVVLAATVGTTSAVGLVGASTSTG